MRRVAALATMTAAIVALSAPARASEKYALLIGLDNYLHQNSMGGIPPLDYAIADVAELSRVLTERGFKTRELPNDKASREDIIANLRWYENNLKETDTFLLYFAGHGVRLPGVRPRTFWLTWKAALEPLDVEGIRLTHLMDYIEDIRAGQKLVLLDHCFSGDVVPGPTDVSDAGLPAGRLARGGSVIDARNARPLDHSAIDALPTRGTALFAAARGSAYEVPAYRHGLFTHFLLQALSTRDADTDKDGVLSLLELQVYLMQHVKEESKKLGQEQTVTEKTDGIDKSSWIVASLPANPSSARAEAKTYILKLTEWSQKQLLSGDVKIRCIQSFEAWVLGAEQGAPVSDLDRSIVQAVRAAVDAKGPEDARATALKFDVAVFTGSTP